VFKPSSCMTRTLITSLTNLTLVAQCPKSSVVYLQSTLIQVLFIELYDRGFYLDRLLYLL